MKKPFLIVGSVFAAGILLLVFTSGGDEVVDSVVTDQLLERPDAPEGKRMVNSANGFVLVNDITAAPLQDLAAGVDVLVENDLYSILYYAQSDLFLVSLLDASKFSVARSQAEAMLPDLLGVTKAQVCDLNIDLTIPPYIDFDRAGSYGFSYCVQSVPIQ